MKKRTIFILLAFLFAAIAPTHAQLGKRLLKQAKETVKKEVEKVTTDAKETVKSKASDAVDEQGVLEEVKENIAPVDDGSDRFLGVVIDPNIEELYKKLDPSVYYIIDGEIRDYLFYKSYEESLKYFNAEGDVLYYAMQAGKDEIPFSMQAEYTDIFYIGEFSINAYFALFEVIGAPTYYLFTLARSYLKAIEEKRICDQLEKKEVINNMMYVGGGLYHTAPINIRASKNRKDGYGYKKEDIVYPFNMDRLTRWKSVEPRLVEKMYNEVDWNIIMSNIVSIITKARESLEKDNNKNVTMYSYWLDIAIEDAKNHPDAVKDEAFDRVVGIYERMLANEFAASRKKAYEEWKDYYAEFDDQYGEEANQKRWEESLIFDNKYAGADVPELKKHALNSFKSQVPGAQVVHVNVRSGWGIGEEHSGQHVVATNKILNINIFFKKDGEYKVATARFRERAPIMGSYTRMEWPSIYVDKRSISEETIKKNIK